ncbi:hypothetical protein SAMN06265367_106164 [Algoriphagus winogradskyi]|uniref:Uncharacterized protein n=1 Tax=Algoriphagus winogradskyi TaxID=237017 RepID=A0ABY1P9N8_9BACT|nr:hypothetical protein SAMN06265367_106164 [Algoriphagus winogradskyi]
MEAALVMRHRSSCQISKESKVTGIFENNYISKSLHFHEAIEQPSLSKNKLNTPRQTDKFQIKFAVLESVFEIVL